MIKTKFLAQKNETFLVQKDKVFFACQKTRGVF
jgi:hypothetical protein